MSRPPFNCLAMRIHAEVDVVNRQLAAQGMKKNGKRSKSQLAIGRKPLAEGGQEVFYKIMLNVEIC